MTRRRLTDALGASLVVAGCVAWAWVAPLQGSVDAAARATYADPRYRESAALGYGELELLVLDLRLAPLLLIVAGLAVLVAWLERPAYWVVPVLGAEAVDRKSTRLNSSHLGSSYAVFC